MIEEKRKEELHDLRVLINNTGSFLHHDHPGLCKPSAHEHRELWSLHTGSQLSILLMTSWNCSTSIALSVFVWSPTDVATSDKIGAMQGAFTWHMIGMSGVNWPSYRKCLLKLFSLERRHERHMCIYMFNILANIVPNPGVAWSYNERTGFCICLSNIIHSSQVDIRKSRNSPIYQAAMLYNSLPRNLRSEDVDNNWASSWQV